MCLRIKGDRFFGITVGSCFCLETYFVVVITSFLLIMLISLFVLLNKLLDTFYTASSLVTLLLHCNGYFPHIPVHRCF